MLFSSYVFILVFLPITMLGFGVCSQRGKTASVLWLLVASFVFYGYWNPIHLPLIAASILINFQLGRWLLLRNELVVRRLCLVAGVVLNLGLISYFKYFGFFADILAAVSGQPVAFEKLVLPLGISFFTFQQLAYLVDAWQGRVRQYTLLEYAFLVMFFPHLIAGPIVQHSDLLTQLEGQERKRLRAEDLSIGVVIFVIGLFKKVVIADYCAPYANQVFDAAASGPQLAVVQAWVGVLAYTLQLYFDFSGYSDMAIGLGRMFSFKLPLNFNSPYQATSIVDFWRRWHMTLSRFLRDYLYIPLGGGRCGTFRKYLNLLLTMALGGLWHGAGWTFVLWGLLHGLFLSVNHVWNSLTDRWGWSSERSLVWRAMSWLLTMACVMAGWILFRADNLTTAVSIGASLGGLTAGELSVPVARVGTTLLLLVGLLACTVVLPNIQQLLAPFEPSSDWETARKFTPAVPGWWKWAVWQPTAFHGVVTSFAFVYAITQLTRIREFLYFQF